MRGIIVLLAFFLVLNGAVGQDAALITERYQDVPKGVVLEGGASGMDALKSLDYDKEKNEFIVNGKERYANPVSRKDWTRVYKSILKDDNLGVTLVEAEPRTYGDISKSSTIATDLIVTDKFLGGLIYGIEHLLGDTKLPGNYKPVRAENRKIPVVAFSAFSEYQFAKKSGAYACAECSLNIILLPLSEKRTVAGGHLPDEALMKTFTMDEADKKNINHVKSFQAEYFKMPQFAKTVAWGEAAAFARHVRDNKIDSKALLEKMK